jgi:hypothetical protein
MNIDAENIFYVHFRSSIIGSIDVHSRWYYFLFKDRRFTSTVLNSIIWTLDNGLTVRNLLSFYYSVFSLVERHLVNLHFLNFIRI